MKTSIKPATQLQDIITKNNLRIALSAVNLTDGLAYFITNPEAAVLAAQVALCSSPKVLAVDHKRATHKCEYVAVADKGYYKVPPGSYLGTYRELFLLRVNTTVAAVHIQSENWLRPEESRKEIERVAREILAN